MEENEKRNKGGRPKVDEPYSSPIRVRYTEKEKGQLEKLCKKHTTDLSKYIRTISLHGLKYYDQNLTIDKIIGLRSEVHKIGVNVNQIASKLNAYIKVHNSLPEHGFTKKDKETIQQLEEMLKTLQTLFAGNIKI